MKKLTTNQWLLLGGTVALIYLLYSKRPKKASEIKDELLNENGQNATKKPVVEKLPQVKKPILQTGTGGAKPMPTKPIQIKPDPRCANAYKRWMEYSKSRKFGSMDEMEKTKAKFLGDCYTPSSGVVADTPRTGIISRI